MNHTATQVMQASEAVAVAERNAFEMKCWGYYQALKAKGWSHPDEGNTADPAALFWRHPSGKYGVDQIEAAWNGWRMAKGLM